MCYSSSPAEKLSDSNGSGVKQTSAPAATIPCIMFNLKCVLYRRSQVMVQSAADVVEALAYDFDQDRL